MSILVTNDDGVNSPTMWSLVGELNRISPVTVVAPAREQSAIGTAVSLRSVVKVEKVEPQLPGIPTYAVYGTPADSVILGLGRLATGVELVVSGINQGTNLGEDVYISGTVGAALQAYTRGFPAMAVSAAYSDLSRYDAAARVAAILARQVLANLPLSDIFINVNLPDLPFEQIKGAKVTRLAHESHVNTVEEHGLKDHYRLVRYSMARGSEGSDIWALEQGFISITPLYTRRFNKSLLPVLHRLSDHLVQEMKSPRASLK
ncbi:MAG: 5'/3'-nucleotidase SurE [Chloroflexi bacterium]|nr:5'/3'-nucleotidase SurE [Chloroflexota bacterium]